MRRPGKLLCLLPLIVLAGSTPGDCASQKFPWKSRFTTASSPALAAFDEAIHAAHPDELRAFHVENVTWSEEDFKLQIGSGTMYLEPAVDGVTVGAFFEGTAAFSFLPRLEGARASLNVNLGHPTFDKVPITTAYLFTLRESSLLTALEQSHKGAAGKPSALSTYLADKSALRQLGMDLTCAFLNKDGPAKGTTYVLLPLDEIHGAHSPDGRLLYRFNPLIVTSIGLSVFGSEQMVEIKPYKFRFYNLLSYNPRKEFPGTASVERVRVDVTPGAGSKPGVEKATMLVDCGGGLRGLRLGFTTRMEISGVVDDAGRPLPFLQWEHLLNNPDFDQSILVDVAGPGKEPLSSITFTVTSKGLLFEPWFDLFVLLDPDDWFSHYHSSGDTQYELRLTIPKDMTGIGIGEKVSEQVDGMMKTVVFQSTHPINDSSFYYGDYTKVEDTIDGVKVELYLSRKDIDQQQNARFVLGQLTSSVAFFDKLLFPLDIKVLRAATTPTLDARGFEGLILLGQAGRQGQTKYYNDTTRAHEVAHQWLGNYVRIKHWPRDRWFYEGMSDYLAMEYYKTSYKAGGNGGLKPLEAIRKGWFEPLTFGSMEYKNLAGVKQQMEGLTANPLLAATDNVYTKGPLVLGMLRYLMKVKTGDDDAFFAMLRDFLSSYKYQAAGTEEFVNFAEKHTGEKLDWFFHQWIEDGGIPVLFWTKEIAQGADGWTVTLKARQEQKSYKLYVPVTLHYEDGTIESRPWIVEGPETATTLTLPKKPVEVTLNDDFELLAVLHAR